jgi:hypothetical protein
MDIEAQVDRRGFLQTSAALAAGFALTPKHRRSRIKHPRNYFPPQPTTPPPVTGSCKWGAYSLARPGETAKSAFLRLEAEVGRPLGITRHYADWPKLLPGSAIDWSGLSGHTPYVEWHATNAVPWTAIAAGEQDAWITAQAVRMAAAPYEMFFCFHHEPEDEPALGTASDFAAAYARIKSRFDAAGVTNLTWVVSLISSTFNGYHGGPDIWLPPDFDLLGTGGYNRYPCVKNKKSQPWRSLGELLDPAHTKALSLGKDMFIGEHGTVEQTANGNTSGDPNAKAQWFADAATTLKSWPEIKGVCYSHTLAKSDGFDLPFWVDTTPQSLAAYIAMGQDPYFA